VNAIPTVPLALGQLFGNPAISATAAVRRGEFDVVRDHILHAVITVHHKHVREPIVRLALVLAQIRPISVEDAVLEAAAHQRAHLVLVAAYGLSRRAARRRWAICASSGSGSWPALWRSRLNCHHRNNGPYSTATHLELDRRRTMLLLLLLKVETAVS